MTVRMRRAAADETGAVLLLALGFIAIIGFLGLALISYSTTNLRATIALRPVRSMKYAADGAVEGAINKFRQDFTVPCGTGPAVTANFYRLKLEVDPSGRRPVDPLLQDVIVDCGSQEILSASSRRATFTAHCPTPGTTTCPTGKTVLVAKVKFDGAAPAAATTVETWSVHQ
jgi:hypothetical protein